MIDSYICHLAAHVDILGHRGPSWSAICRAVMPRSSSTVATVFRAVCEVSQLRNSPDGFWVASTRPEAGDMAVTGTLGLNDGGTTQQIRAAALLSDGAATLVERHGGEWSETMRLLEEGPRVLIGHVRSADEVSTGKFRGKRHDDATAVLCRFPASAYRAAEAD